MARDYAELRRQAGGNIVYNPVEAAEKRRSSSGRDYRSLRQKKKADAEEMKINRASNRLAVQENKLDRLQAQTVAAPQIDSRMMALPSSGGMSDVARNIQNFQANAPAPRELTSAEWLERQKQHRRELNPELYDGKGFGDVLTKYVGEPLAQGLDRLQTIPGLSNFQKGAGNAIGAETNTAPLAKGIGGKAAEITGNLAGFAVNPAAIDQNLVTGGYKVANAAVQAGKNKIPALTNLLPGKLNERVATGAIAGAYQNTALEAAKGNTDVSQLGEAAATGALFGGLGDGTAHLVGQGIKAGAKALAPMFNKGAAAVGEAASDIGKAAGNVPNSGIAFGQRTGPYDNLKTSTKSQLVTKTKRQRSSTKGWMDRMYTALVDDIHSLNQFDKATEAVTGAKLAHGDRVHSNALATRGADVVSNQILTNGLVDSAGNVIGKSLKERLATIPKGKFVDFEDYLVNKHAITRAERGEQVFRDELNWTPEKGQQILADYDAKYPQFAAAATDLYDFQNTLLQKWLVEPGIITEAQAKAYLDANPFYVPMKREFTDLEKAGTGFKPKKGFAGQSNPNKKYSKTGSQRKIISPIESIIENVDTMVKTAKRNAVMQTFVNNLAKAPEDLKGFAEIVNQPPKTQAPRRPSSSAEIDTDKLKRGAKEKELNSPLGINQDSAANIAKVPDQVGSLFDAHGMTKGGVERQLDDLISLLKNGIDPKRQFFSARLTDKGALSPFKEGSFIVMSGPKESLKTKGIKNVIVNDAFYEAIPDLAKAFPNVNFIRADKVSESLETLIKNPNARINESTLTDDTIEDLLSSLDEDFSRVMQNTKLDKDNIVRVLVNGEPVHVKINDKALLEAVTALGPQSGSKLLDAVGWLTNKMKVLTTGANPMFSLTRNIVRDIPQAYVASKTTNNPLRFAVDLVDAAWSITRDKELYQQFKNMGGGHSSSVAADRNMLKQSKRAILPQSKFTLQGAIPRAYGKMENLLNAVESAPRLAEFKRLSKAGDTPRALFESQDVTVNFKRKGKLTRDLDKVFPYFNAAVQGLDKFGRMYKDNLGQATVKSFVALTVPTMIAYAYNYDNPDYQKLSNHVKDNFLLIPKGDGTFYKIAKPREIGTVFSDIPERMLRQFRDEDPEGFKGFVEQIRTSFTLPGIQGLLKSGGITKRLSGALGDTILGPIADIQANKNYNDSPIVPGYLENLSPELQYDARTSSLSKKLGGLTGTSPKELDYLIGQYSGVLGQVGLPMMARSGNNPLQSLGNSFIKQITADPVYTNEIMDKFYKNKSKYDQANTDSGVTGKLPKWYDDETRKALARYSKDISSIRAEMRTIENDSKISAEQKRQQLRMMQDKMNSIALEANKLVP